VSSRVFRVLRGEVLLSSAFVALLLLATAPSLPAQSDLDAFMQDVLAHRDDNWKKLQQYILDEHEEIQLTGPSRIPIWGEKKDYTWFIREGFFVRSPVKVNGASVSESERRKYENEFLQRAKERDRRGLSPGPQQSDADARDVDSLIRQARQPQFISSAYFLRFRFEEGKYALVGHETIDGRDTLRVEYYPSKLFNREQRWTDHDATSKDRARAAELERMLNKVSLITLWIEPKAAQIVKYTFNNVAFDFLPGSWLVHLNDVKASMTMGQPFPDVWLPSNVDVAVTLTIAVGQYDVRYGLQYHDYRRADVNSILRIPEAR